MLAHSAVVRPDAVCDTNKAASEKRNQEETCHALAGTTAAEVQKQILLKEIGRKDQQVRAAAVEHERGEHEEDHHDMRQQEEAEEVEQHAAAIRYPADEIERQHSRSHQHGFSKQTASYADGDPLRGFHHQPSCQPRPRLEISPVDIVRGSASVQPHDMWGHLEDHTPPGYSHIPVYSTKQADGSKRPRIMTQDENDATTYLDISGSGSGFDHQSAFTRRGKPAASYCIYSEDTP